MREELSAVIDRVSELRVLEPDAEADACGAAFSQFVHDRMDEWHAALDAYDGQGVEALSREVLITRSAHELAARFAENPPWTRTLAFVAEFRRLTAYAEDDRESAEAIEALRARLEPAFRQSKHWQTAVSLLVPSYAVPWIVQPCRELVRVARKVHEDKPSPMMPWIALWARGVWAVPFGDGAVGVWVPSLDSGVDGLHRALFERRFSDWTQTPMSAMGFFVPHSDAGPGGGGGIELFGPDQTDGLSPAPPLVLRPRAPFMPINPVAPPRPEMMTNIPMRPPPITPQWPPEPVGTAPPPTDSATAPPGSQQEPASLMDRLRRWFKK